MEKILKTKIIFVSFLIADISLNLGDGCNYCKCCKDCWGKEILEGEEEKVLEDEEWNKAVSSFTGDFSNDNFFENKYQNFNIFYDSVIDKIKKKQFDAIKNLYNQKVAYIKPLLKCENCSNFNKKDCYCSSCTNTKNCAYINGLNFCEECFTARKSNLSNKLKLSVCIPRFTLLKKDKYFVLKVSVLAIYVDEDDNLFIRGDWRDKATYSDKFFEEKPENKLKNPENKLENPENKQENQENKLFKRISDDEKFNNIYVYNYQKTDESELKKTGNFNITNKSHLYFVLGEKDENSIFYNQNFGFMDSLSKKGHNEVLQQTKDLYTSFAFCFHAAFYIIYSSLLFKIDSHCGNKSKKICPGGLHYYFSYESGNGHSSIEELLNNQNLAGINVTDNNLINNNDTIKSFSEYFVALYKKMFDLPDKLLNENCYAEIRKNSFSSSKNLLESIKTGFENSEYIVQ